ncbi:D-alanine--(R)-lactate ligase [Enterococcus dongliensis]|uniref:D-alanine--(R)-lactate ligase n=1 Tax=Enterococcus dongliensis TaxID=2559925 RepID=UPI00288C7ED7|nr:D-alanine--(R)-lactate ligase [Enterococcus dongliensis]MDT2639556.1 D-alanine--(R)-lactate ligase [Enterococcus dongliensis]MDT2670345.1 D-alanine--(R)-lactate ligase [Enterococcus dongliensis]MDT2675932.1 D-alanine--(R)-lactate ligase [Enterococcus dongliensis]MDT2702776.1 D-alanine--(R)-lactate ligase [Enterococcus dongliensis]
MKKTIAILFGGMSEEHEVSIKSAKEIAANIDVAKYQPIYVGITTDGQWKRCAEPEEFLNPAELPTIVLVPDQMIHGLVLLTNGNYQIIHIDVVFSVLHGKTGEDGAIQGLFELSGIPYVGCDIPSSVLCMDKALTYLITRDAGFHTPNFLILQQDEQITDQSLTYPVFVKPARSGSSFGITKVSRKSELHQAIEIARNYDQKILIEEAVSGIEVGCAVLGNHTQLFTGEVDQITLSHGFFKIHQEKDPDKGSENSFFTVPAALPLEKQREIQQTAKNIYNCLGCIGLARIDLFLTDDGRLVINEINTMPGFTSYSRYPRMMKAAGISISQLIEKSITLALEK